MFYHLFVVSENFQLNLSYSSLHGFLASLIIRVTNSTVIFGWKEIKVIHGYIKSLLKFVATSLTMN